MLLEMYNVNPGKVHRQIKADFNWGTNRRRRQ